MKRHVAIVLTSLTTLVAVCSTAQAQSSGRMAVGVSISAKQGVARDTDGHINPAFVWRFGHGHDGWGWDFGLGWYAADLQRTVGGAEMEFGELHVRPLMAGYGYSKRISRRTTLSAKVLGGYSFNSFKVTPAYDQAFQQVHGTTTLGTDVSNTVVIRPEISSWIDLSRKFGVTLSTGYSIARPEVTVRTSSGTDSRRIRADMFTFRVGVVYSIF
jgi:hypothetical protein